MYEGVQNGIWMAGSEFDKKFWANAEQQSLRDRDTEYEYFKKKRQEDPNYQFNEGERALFQNRIAGSARPEDGHGYWTAADARFNEFLQPSQSSTQSSTQPSTQSTNVGITTPSQQPKLNRSMVRKTAQLGGGISNPINMPKMNKPMAMTSINPVKKRNPTATINPINGTQISSPSIGIL